MQGTRRHELEIGPRGRWLRHAKRTAPAKGGAKAQRRAALARFVRELRAAVKARDNEWS